jgi:ectoine hydroxylase-related dioxygenase (phytanoyl-CoA dioxygenase family)
MDGSAGGFEALTPWLGGQSFQALKDRYDADGYLIFERVLNPQQVADLRAALQPFLDGGKTGRNNFEGYATNRVYAMLAKSPLFAELAIHPLALAFAEADLGPSCLLSACLAINLHPGETAQPWHYDDSVGVPRPRAAYGLSAFWALDDTTELNGATEIIPGSHLWGEDRFDGALVSDDFTKGAAPDGDPGARTDSVKLVMPAGSLAIAKGTLWHRGGANRSDADRLIITPQYCAGWVRQLENMVLAVPPAIAATLPERAQELIGYSIHPAFMGYVDGVHPKRTLAKRTLPR